MLPSVPSAIYFLSTKNNEGTPEVVIDPVDRPSDVDEEIIVDDIPPEHLGVMRFLLIVPSLYDSLKRHSIFHTNVKYGDKSYKLVIDNGSEQNVISSRGVVRLGLKLSIYPNLFIRKRTVKLK